MRIVQNSVAFIEIKDVHQILSNVFGNPVLWMANMRGNFYTVLLKFLIIESFYFKSLIIIRLAKATKSVESYSEQNQDLEVFSGLLNWKDCFLVKRFIGNGPNTCKLKFGLAATLKKCENDASEMFAYLRLYHV